MRNCRIKLLFLWNISQSAGKRDNLVYQNAIAMFEMESNQYGDDPLSSDGSESPGQCPAQPDAVERIRRSRIGMGPGLCTVNKKKTRSHERVFSV